MKETDVVSVHIQDMLGGVRKTFSIARGDKWLKVGSNPKIGRDVDAMFSANSDIACTYANEGAAKRVIKIFEKRGVTGLEAKPTPEQKKLSYKELSELIDSENMV